MKRVVVLAALLASSIAIAWAYAEQISAPRRRGAEFVADLHRMGLKQMLPDTSARFYLHKREAVVGWRAALGGYRPDGTYEGLDIVLRQISEGNAAGQWERWRLDDSANTGYYVAGGFRFREGQWEVIPTTWIKLAGPRVLVQQNIKGRAFRSAADVPDSYLPEGTMDLALRAMRGQARSRQFNFIDNSIPPTGGKPQFIGLKLRDITEETPLPAGTVAAIESSIAGQPKEIVFLDEQGLIHTTKRGKLSETRSSPAELYEHFPQLDGQLRQIQQAVQLVAPLD
ncbi:hypothetical protein LCGC14_0284770 [marine sediment metagenome]|uniref:Uncharacterized protein n=1 Tax=marine sediment metagenome TaxID=412755 RepID=A0A0F9X0D4_9ZZZZ|nr:hypothetical protein [Phycisphaerae bacterium]HDZ45010.1 hypothetical protein [Phycisphaerae bacterium]